MVCVSALALLLSCCTSGPPRATAPYGVPYDIFSKLVAQSVDLGPVGPTRPITFTLGLRNTRAHNLRRDLASLYDPPSPDFMHFLSRAEFDSRYGADPGDATAAVDLLRASGLRADWSTGDSWVVVSGPARVVQHVFGVDIHDYVSPRNVHFYSSVQDATVPGPLRELVASVGRIDDYAQPTASRLPDAIPAGGLLPADLLKAYDITPLRDLGFDGRGETVVFIEPDKQSFRQSDLDTFTNDPRFKLPAIQVLDRGIPSAQFPPGGETEMDLEVVHEIAPGANLVLYNTDTKEQELFDVQTQVVNDYPGAIVSQSWGWCESAWTNGLISATNDLYAKADMLGTSVFVSSGDSGAYTCLEAADPGTFPSDEYLTGSLPCDAPGVTCVGGTRLSVRSDGTHYNETVWEEPPLTEGGGGGLSRYYLMPTWQSGPGVLNRYSTGKREFPDVSADADPISGAAIFTRGHWGTGGGTSQAAPIWAGIAAVMAQFLKAQGLKQPLGHLNPALYAIGRNPAPYAAFHDVTVGTNLYYPATPGYDLASGLGSPDVWNLARDFYQYRRGGA